MVKHCGNQQGKAGLQWPVDVGKKGWITQKLRACTKHFDVLLFFQQLGSTDTKAGVICTETLQKVTGVVFSTGGYGWRYLHHSMRTSHLALGSDFGSAGRGLAEKCCESGGREACGGQWRQTNGVAGHLQQTEGVSCCGPGYWTCSLVADTQSGIVRLRKKRESREFLKLFAIVLKSSVWSTLDAILSCKGKKVK